MIAVLNVKEINLLAIYFGSSPGSGFQMRQSLEARLAAAEILRKAAEREMLEKEESARKALAEQEAMMEKVVQESARLQHEAEENSKVHFISFHGI